MKLDLEHHIVSRDISNFDDTWLSEGVIRLYLLDDPDSIIYFWNEKRLVLKLGISSIIVHWMNYIFGATGS